MIVHNLKSTTWLQILDTKESFCMADIEIGAKRTVIMTTKKFVELMARCKGLRVDGTFCCEYVKIKGTLYACQ